MLNLRAEKNGFEGEKMFHLLLSCSWCIWINDQHKRGVIDHNYVQFSFFCWKKRISIISYVLLSKTYDTKKYDERGYRDEQSIDKAAFENAESNVEYDDKWFFGDKCKKKRITVKNVQNEVVFED